MATTTKSGAGALLAAVYTALNVTAITTTLGCSVHDSVPQTQTFPYLRISTPAGLPWDTFGKAGKTRVLHVDIFSQYRGRLEVQNIMDKTIELLQYQALSLSGHTLVNLAYEQDIDANDEDIVGVKTAHKVVMFRVHFQET